MRLHEWRDANGVSTAGLAALCGVKRNAMHLILTGITFPLWKTVRAIAAATDGAVTVADLVAEYEEARQRSVELPPSYAEPDA